MRKISILLLSLFSINLSFANAAPQRVDRFNYNICNKTLNTVGVYGVMWEAFPSIILPPNNAVNFNIHLNDKYITQSQGAQISTLVPGKCILVSSVSNDDFDWGYPAFYNIVLYRTDGVGPQVKIGFFDINTKSTYKVSSLNNLYMYINISSPFKLDVTYHPGDYMLTNTKTLDSTNIFYAQSEKYVAPGSLYDYEFTLKSN